MENYVHDFFKLSLLMFVFSMSMFFFVIGTTYAKLSIVMSLIRNALGTQNVPPNAVINALAVIVAVYIMLPIAADTYKIAQQEQFGMNTIDEMVAGKDVSGKWSKVTETYREFLKRNSSNSAREFFYNTTKKIWPKQYSENVSKDNLLILLPAFSISEITEAFQIAFILFVPFVIIDLVISNILLAMGMMMVSPMTISLPFKILLFVAVDGWAKLIYGLVLTY